MNIGAIANALGTVGSPVISDGASQEDSDQGVGPAIWFLDEAGWPIEEEGWPLEGQLGPKQMAS